MGFVSVVRVKDGGGSSSEGWMGVGDGGPCDVLRVNWTAVDVMV